MGSMFTLLNNQTGFPPTSLATLSLPPSQPSSPPPSSKPPFSLPCCPSLISVVLLASKCITPKSMLLTVIFLPGSRSYFIASWWFKENVTLRSPAPPLRRWTPLIDGLEISGEPNVTGRLHSEQDAQIAPIISLPQRIPPRSQLTAGLTSFPLWSLEPSSSSPPFLQTLGRLPPQCISDVSSTLHTVAVRAQTSSLVSLAPSAFLSRCHPPPSCRHLSWVQLSLALPRNSIPASGGNLQTAQWKWPPSLLFFLK